LNRRVASVLIGGLLCLPGVSTLSLSASAAAAATRTSAARAAKSNTAVRATAVRTALMSETAAEAAGISPKVLTLAVSALSCAVKSGDIAVPRTLTVIDYSLPSVEPRLWVFDVATGELMFKELVAHGRNTGENMATRFSDTLNSRQSSIGLFVARDTYVGSNGYSLRMNGLEPGFNGNALDRAIVMHGAPYVDAALAKQQGRIGRSWGCPALREAIARDVIDTVRGGGVIFSYYPDKDWLTSSRFLNCDRPATKDTEAVATKDTKITKKTL
jgi:hypothetical protein